MPIGTVVCAARAGRVARVIDENQWPDDDSNSVRIHHEDLSMACYSHLKQHGVLVAGGDWVNAGEPIALSGNTGCSGRQHLHFHVIAGIERTRVPTRFRTEFGIVEMLLDDVFYTRPLSEVARPSVGCRFRHFLEATGIWNKSQVETHLKEELKLAEVSITETERGNYPGAGKGVDGKTYQLQVRQVPGGIACDFTHERGKGGIAFGNLVGSEPAAP